MAIKRPLWGHVRIHVTSEPELCLPVSISLNSIKRDVKETQLGKCRSDMAV